MTKITFTKKILSLTLFLGMTWVVNAQSKVGQNVVNLNSNAVFEMEHNAKGMLLPRIALSATTAFVPLSAHIGGMVVYNTATAGDVTPGFYYNDGTKWVRLAGSSSPTGSGNLTNENGFVVTGGTGTTLINTSLRLDSSAVAKMMVQPPVKDSLNSVISSQISAGTVTGQNLTAGSLLVTTGTPTGASLKAAGYAVNTTALKDSTALWIGQSPIKDSIATVLSKSPVKDSLTSAISNQITAGAVTGQNFTSTSGGALIVTGGSGTSLKATSIAVNKDSIVTSTQVSKVLNSAPAKDTLSSIISNQITAGTVTGQNFTSTSGGALIVTGGSGTSLKATSIAVNKDSIVTSTQVSKVLNSAPAKDTLSSIISNQITAGTVTGQNFTSTSGGALIVTGGSGTSLKATSIAVNKDSIVTSTQVSKVLNSAPAKDTLSSIISSQITSGTVTGQNLTAGSLLVTTGTPTGASLKAAGYAVNTTALKDSTALWIGQSPIKDSIATVLSKSPVKDSLTSAISNQITAGAVTGQNFTSTSGGALIVTGGSGTSLKATSIAVNKDSIVTSTQVSKVLNSAPAKDTLSSIISSQITAGTVTGQNFTSTSGGALIVTGGSGTSLKATSIAVNKDSIVTSTQVSKVLNSAPAKDTLSSIISSQISAGTVTGQNLTAGSLLVTTGTPTGASLKAAGYAVNTTALKDSTALWIGQSPIKDSIATVLSKSPVKDSLTSAISNQITAGAVTGQNFTSTSGGALIVTGGSGTSLKATSIAVNKDSIVTSTQVSKVLNSAPAKDTLSSIISNQITAGTVTGQNFTSTSGGALIVTGGSGTSLKATSIAVNKDSIVTSTQVSKVLNSAPAKDTLSSIISSQIAAGSVTGQNLTAGSLLVTTGTPTGASLKAAGYAVDTTALKGFVATNLNSSPIKDSLTTVISNQITNGTVTGQDFTSTSGGALIVTGGSGTSLKATSIAVNKDSIVTSTQVSKVLNTAPAKDTLSSIISSQITSGTVTGQNLTAGSLLVTTGTPTGASLKAAGYAVDTTALKGFVATNLNSSPIKDSLTTIINSQITAGAVTGQNLTAGSLLQTTGTPTGASLKAVGYQVDTNALKTFIGRVAPLTADSTTASNGLTMTGKDVRLGGALTAATTITTTSTNTLALAGLQSGATTDSILVVNPTTNVVSRISAGKFKNGNLIVTTAASLTVADTVDVVIFRGTAAATITLPAAASNVGKVIRILNYAASATNIDITLSPEPVIQGGTTNITNPTVSSHLTSYGSNAASAIGNTIEVVSDGTNWYKLGN
jgi:hypothetical protein